MTLFQTKVRNDRSHREAIDVDSCGACARAVSWSSEWTAYESQGVAVKSEIVFALRPKRYKIVVGDCSIQWTIQPNAGRAIDPDDAVNGGCRAKRHHLTDLRSNRETINHDFLGVTRSVTCGQIDCARSQRGQNRVVNHSGRQTRRNRDAGRHTESFRVRRDTLWSIARNEQPSARHNRTCETIDGQNRGASRITSTVVDCTSQRRIANGDAGCVLAHEQIEAEFATKAGFPQRRAIVTDTIGISELAVVEESGFRVRSQNEIPTRHISLVDVHLVTDARNVLDRVAGGQAAKSTVGCTKKLVHLTKKNLIDESCLRKHGRSHVFVDEAFHRLRFFAVLDDERNVNVLVQRNLNIRGRHVLNGHIIRVRFSVSAEFAWTTSVDNIAHIGDNVLEVTVDEIRDHHVLFQNGQRFVGPKFRNERIGAVIVNSNEWIRRKQLLLHHFDLPIPCFLRHAR